MPSPYINLNNAVPNAPPGSVNSQFQGDSGYPTRNVSSCQVIAFGQQSVIVKTTDYVALQADDGAFIVFDSSSPRTLLLPASLSYDTWKITVLNIGTADLTIDPHGLEINALAGDITLPSGSGITIYTDGTNYFADGGTGGGGGGSTGGLPAPKIVTLNPGAAGDFTVAHGLGSVPDAVILQIESAEGGDFWYQPTPYDDTNLYLISSDPSVTGRALVWAASSSAPTGANFADNETPSGTIDGVNTTFALAHAPSPTGSLQFYWNGVLQIQGVNYTLVGTTITMTGGAPDGSDSLRAWYRY